MRRAQHAKASVERRAARHLTRRDSTLRGRVGHRPHVLLIHRKLGDFMPSFVRNALLSVSLSLAPWALSPAIAGSANFLMWQMPSTGISFPIYVYQDGKQVDYLYGTTQQAFLGAYDPSSTTATYTLYYQQSGSWFSCVTAISKGVIDTTHTTCPGTVINAPVPTSNVYTIGPGASAWPAAAAAPTNPVETDYSARTITLYNNTSYSMIQIGELCTTSANPGNSLCTNNQNLYQIAQGESATFTVGEAGLISYGFIMTAYTDAEGNTVSTGGYGAGEQPYATKVEFTTLPVDTSGGYPVPQGSTNVDVSAVDGYNVAVTVYPSGGAYCTYTVPPENSNVLGADLYGGALPLGNLLADAATCAASSQLPSGGSGTAWTLSVTSGSDFLGCMSPCTYATQNGSADQALYCCTGNYGTASTCDQPAGTAGANTSTYVSNLVPPTSVNVYRYAYDDAIGDHACPAQTNFIVRFGGSQAL